jgi:hypothetical protein
MEPQSTPYPTVGARARQWKRFERDLEAWLATNHGRFAQWRAERQVAGQPPFCATVTQSAQRPRTSTSA